MKKRSPYLILLHRLIMPMYLLFFFSGGLYATTHISANHPSKVAYAKLALSKTFDFVVKGTVRDANGPLQGATITEKGASKQTITNAAGQYSLNTSGPNVTLVISFVGYNSTEVKVGGKSEVNIILTPLAGQLSDVVVTALGITRAKKSLGYSVGEIKGEDMNKVSQTNLLNSMAGKVSGVSINSTGGAPTSSVSVVIRGIRSLNTDNQPLFVVDGVPVKNSLNNVSSNTGGDNTIDYGNAISDLNPNDIESLTVLKGPSAAALYGSRAGNGVILITTKSGKKAKGLGVTFSSNNEVATPYKFLETNQSYTVGNHPYTTANSSNSLDGTNIIDLAGTDTYRFGTPLNVGIKAIQWNSVKDASGNFIPTELKGYNNLKNFVQNGITSVNSLSIENSNEKDNYRFSYSNTANTGILPTTGLARNNLGLNIEHKITDKFKVTTSLNYTRSNADNIAAGDRGGVYQDIIYLSPSIDVRQMQNYWLTPGIQQRAAITPVDLGLQGVTDYDFNNPYFTLNQVKNSFLRNRLFGNVKFDYQINKHFTAFVRYSQDMLNERRETKISKSLKAERKGYYGLQNLFNTESNTDFLINYKNTFNDFTLSASGGGNLQYVYGSNQQSYSQSGVGIIAPELFNLSNISSTGIRANAYSSQKALYSVYGTATVGYKDIAYLDLTGRNDWSSTLPTNANAYFYPSASLSLIVNKMINFGTAVDLVKVRGGYASVGKDTDPYNLYGTLGIGSFGATTIQAVSGSLKNPALKPEQAISTEFGIDLAFLKNRLRFEGTVYQSDNKNQVLGISTPPSSGYTSRQINAGLVRSEGIELQLGGTLITNKNWNWDLSVNYTKNNSYVISLADGVPYYQFWGDGPSGSWTYAKGQTIPNNFNADGSPMISDGKIGQIWDNKLLTVTDKSSKYYGWPLLDDGGGQQKFKGGAFNAKEIVGNFNPKLLLGIQTAVTYKRFTLSASIDTRLGGEFFSQTYRYVGSDAVLASQMDMGIKIPDAYKNNIPAYLKSNPDAFIKMSGFQTAHVVGGPTKALGGVEYEDNGETSFDGTFYPGVYSDGNGGYIENLGDPATTHYGYYTDAVTANWNFAKQNMFDASYIKLRELNLSFDLPKEWFGKAKLQGVSFGLYTRNIIIWTKAKCGIDPEAAFYLQAGAQGNGSQFRQGIERYNVTPWTIPAGVKLNVRF
jgi:TonB-linked SusC/RagA family outer membrane protein